MVIVVHPDIGIMKVHSTIFVNPASSDSRTVAANCLFGTQFSKRQRQNTTPVQWSLCDALSGCCCSWRILRARGTPIPSAAAVLRTLFSGIFSRYSKYENFSKTLPYLSRHQYLGIC
jgi:hypothetical protein